MRYLLRNGQQLIWRAPSQGISGRTLGDEKKEKNKAEISLNKTERTLIRFGLNMIVNGLAAAKAGFFPSAHPLERIDPAAANIYRKRAFSTEFASKLIPLRNRLSAERRKQTFWLDTFDLAAAALALRVTREKRLWEQGCEVDKCRLVRLSDPPEDEVARLEGKVENARRRATPSARHPNRSQYEERAKAWRAFVAWMRYNLLYDEAQCERIFKRGIGIHLSKMVARLRFKELLDATREIIAERTTAHIPESELLRLVKLARNELQPSRRRHPQSNMGLMNDREKMKEFMFESYASDLGRRTEEDGIFKSS